MKNSPIEWNQVKQYVKKGFGKDVEVPTHAVLIYGGLKKKIQKATDNAAKSAPGAIKKMASSTGSRSTAKTSAKKPADKKVSAASRQTKRTVVKKVSAKRAAKPASKKAPVKEQQKATPVKKESGAKKSATKTRVAANSKPSTKRMDQARKTSSLGGSALRDIISKAFHN